MATALENLQTARDQIAEQIAALTASYRPDSSLDGQAVQHGKQLEVLNRQLTEVLKAINRLNPWTTHSQVL